MKTFAPYFFLLIAVLLFSSPSCKKYHPPKPDNPYGLPNATQRGKGTFACLVNGKPWIAEAADVRAVYNESIGFAAWGVLRPTAMFELLSVGMSHGILPIKGIYHLHDTLNIMD